MKIDSPISHSSRPAPALGYVCAGLLCGGLLSLSLLWDNSVQHLARVQPAAIAAAPGNLDSILGGTGLDSAPYAAPANPFAFSPAKPQAPSGREATTPSGNSPQASTPPANPAATRFAQGMAAQKAGQNNVAFTAYQDTLRLKPAFTPARLALSALYLQMRRPSDALDQLQLAHHTDPKNPAVSWQMAQTLLMLHRVPEAIAPLHEVINLAPKNRAGYVLLAQAMMSLKRPDEAYQQWTRLAAAQPKDPEAAFTAGAIAFESLKRLPDAEHWLRRAAVTDPKDPRVPLLLGRVLAMRGKPGDAATVLARGAHDFPSVIEINTLLSDVRWATGDKVGAISALRAAARCVPESQDGGQPRGRLQVALGRLYALRSQWSNAVHEWQLAATLMPREADIHGMMAEALMRKGDGAGSAAELRQVLAIDPTRQSTRHHLAALLAGLGRVDEAQQEYVTYLKANPGDVGARAQQATLYEHQGNIEGAIAAWNQAGTVMPESPIPPLQRARLLHKSGNDSEALDQYRYALQLAPNNPPALIGAAQLEAKSGQNMRALTHLRVLVEQQPDNSVAYETLLQVSAKTKQMPATLNFLKQQLIQHPDQRATYDALLQGYAQSDAVDKGREIVKAFIEQHPKLAAPRLALDSFDLTRAKAELAELRKAKPTATPPDATPTPAATPLPAAPSPGEPATVPDTKPPAEPPVETPNDEPADAGH